MKSEKFIYLSLFLVLFLFYGGTIGNGFVHDDVKVIRDNPYFKSWSNFPKVFTGCVVEPVGGCAKQGIYYRPILSLSQFLTYRVSDSSHFFHFVHLLYVYIFLITLFFFLNTFFKNRWLSFFGVLIFIIHPVNSEVINWVSTASEPIAGIFLMLSVIFYTKFVHKKKKFLVFSVFFYTLALFTKESVLFFPLILVILEGGPPKADRPIGSSLKRFYRPSGSRMTTLLVFLIPILFYFLCRYLVLGSVWGRSESYYSMSILAQLTTALVALPFYILKIIEPFPLNHGYVYVPASWWQVMGAVVFWAVGVVWTVRKVRPASRRQATASRGGEVGVGIVWFLVLLLPAVLFVDRLGQFVFSERYLFVPMIGVVLGAMGAVGKIGPAFAKLRRGKVVGGIALVVFIASWFVIFNRNQDWKNNITIWIDVVKKNPSAGIGYFNLAHAYEDNKDVVNAARFYRKTIDQKSDYVSSSLINLAQIYGQEGQFDVAGELLQKALKLEDKAFIHHNLGGIFEKEKKLDFAAREYRKALNLDPNFTPARESLHRLNRDDYKIPSVEKENMQYVSVGALSFYFPKDWYISKIDQGILLQNSTKDFTAEFLLFQKNRDMLPSEYIQKQQKGYGSLLDEGLAEVSAVNYAYVRLFSKNNEKKLQFFLFKDPYVVESFVYPPGSPEMQKYATILSTLEFAEAN